MTQNGFAYFADALVFVHGPKALEEAARHAELCEREGDMETAARWRRTMVLVGNLGLSSSGKTSGTKQKHCLAA
ncbi:MAG: hypothetical protein JNM45_14820 [Rhizobiales bacterium]|nr:hypothetical protein [Hyphomicrobiales bacterium]